MGTGNDATAYKNDFWVYEPLTDTWTERAKLTVNGIEKGLAYATGFSIGSKGYLGTGYNLGNKDDFFEFNPTLNTWITKLPILTGARQSSVGFSIGGKGYIGTGFNAAVYRIKVQYDGKILVGGTFIEYNGTSCNNIIRLNGDGSIDTTFNLSLIHI